jgi:DNA polymerase III delta prime subunit
MSNQEFFEKVGTSAPRYDGGRQGVEMSAQSQPCPPDEPHRGPSPTTGAKRWAANHDTFWGATQTYDQLPAGLYRCGEAPNVGPTLHRIQVETDNLLTLPDDDSTEIIAEFKRFWEVEDEFRKRGFLMKRGFLLWGPPGSGKTSTIQLLIKELIEHNNGIVLLVEHPHLAAVCLQMVRQIEPKRPIIAVMEDVDALIERFGENQYLALLDGEAQVDNITFVACPAPETLILKADLTWVRADTLVEGDEIIGFDDDIPNRKYRTAKVVSCPIVECPKRYKVTCDDGTVVVVSENHPFLIRLGNRPFEWRKVQDLNVGNRITTIGHPWSTDETREGGYLAGQFDGEGHIGISYNSATKSRGFHVGWVQASGEIVERVQCLIEEKGFSVSRYEREPTGASEDGTPHKHQTSLRVGGGKWETLRFIGSIRPYRLLANPKLRQGWEDCRLCCNVTEVVSLEEIGRGPVVALETTTGTFIGEGLLQHNSTNYPERLDKRFVDRPSRFDTVRYIGMPSAEAREVYLKTKEPSLEGGELAEWVKASEGFSVAHLKEMIIAVKCFGQTLSEVAERLEAMHSRRPTSADAPDRATVGFAAQLGRRIA